MRARGILVLALTFLSAGSVLALDQSSPAVNAAQARAILGNGTGVIVGIIDSGIDPYHPALAGNDSLGNPRMVAQANFVPTESSNTGMDVYGHGTAVAGVVMSADSTYRGIAPDARYVNARVLDSNNSFQTDAWVVNGAGFALQNGAQIINMSLSYGAVNSDGNYTLSLMTDWLTYDRKALVVNAAGNNGSLSGTSHVTRGPGDAFNGFSIAASASTSYTSIASFSSWGATSDGRNRPTLTAPGQSIATANSNWEGSTADFLSWSGTSFAAPHVAGMLALAVSYGNAHGLSVDPKVLTVTLLSSAAKINDRDNTAWAPLSASSVSGVYTATQSLDDQSGAGQMNGQKFAQLYVAGPHTPNSAAAALGWDLNTVTGTTAHDYVLGQLLAGSTLSATLNWLRHVARNDNGNGTLDSGDTFYVAETLDNLDLTLLRDGVPVAASISTADNLEHIYFTIAAEGQYTLRVDRKAVSGSGTNEEYALAWFGTSVPEPGTALLLAALFPLLGRRARRNIAAAVAPRVFM